MSLDPAGARAGESLSADRAYSPEEQHALRLAGQLRDQVGRERETVRRLRAFLVEEDDGGT